MFSPGIRAVFVSTLLTLAACSEASSTGSAGEDAAADAGVALATDSGADTDVQGPIVDATPRGPTGKDTGSPRATGDCDTDPGGFGCPCENNADCDSAWCIEHLVGYVCTETCLETCPADWQCLPVQNAGIDVTYLCVPQLPTLCAACSSDDDCGGADDLCVAVGDATFCGGSCEADIGCPPGYACEEATGTGGASRMQCLPTTGSCECTPELDGKVEACSRTTEHGQCFGERTCDGPAGWSECSAKEPAAEICNGIDDDCDGEADEELGGEACETKSALGACAGVMVCGPDGLVCGAPEPAEETCNGNDDDCDGAIDEGPPTDCVLYHHDSDGDGHGTEETQCLCSPDGAFSALTGGDCDDGDPAVHSGAAETCNEVDDDCDGAIDEGEAEGCVTYFEDLDGDGYGGAESAACLCGPTETHGATVGGDCDEGDPAINPSATEVCNGADDDCDGATDEQDAVGCHVYHEDKDKDGWGKVDVSACLCAPTGDLTAILTGDCDDASSKAHPSAKEICNGLDDDCDGTPDGPGAGGCQVLYRDEDGDGHGQTGETLCLCNPQGTFTASAGGDCDDSDQAIHPGAVEACNGADDDCNGVTDDAGAVGCLTRYQDKDQDGFGATATAFCLCAPTGDHTTSTGGDCDDTNSTVHPDATESCNGKDDDCDGATDEEGAATCLIYYHDADGDTFGTASSQCLCAKAGLYTATAAGDCDDTNATVLPGAPEACNGKDDDCDGAVDEAGASGCATFHVDLDSDGWGGPDSQCLCAALVPYSAITGGDCDDDDPASHPGAPPVCNGKDDDCDGVIDGPGSLGCVTLYADSDGDGFGVGAACLCAPAGDHTAAAGGDCEDGDSAVHPGATELCNDEDDDCDGVTDEADAVGCGVLYPDEDEDGYGLTAGASCLCGPTGAHVAAIGGDCDDTDPAVGPGGAEVCNGVDDDCDGTVDQDGALGCFVYYNDGDGDGFGLSDDARCICAPLPPYSTWNGGDCDDADPAIHPGALEACASAADCCYGGWTCAYETCLAKTPPCLANQHCQGDTYCDAGVCVPYGVGPATEDAQCKLPTQIGVFLPALQCQWAGPPPGDPWPTHVQVLSTPMVVDFDLDDDPATLRPSIVFVSYGGTDGGFASASANGIIRVLDGSTCEQLHNVDAHKVVGGTAVAIGDLDLSPDGRPEIVAFAEGGGLVAFRWDATTQAFAQLWHSTKNGAPSTLGSAAYRWNGPSLVDLTGDDRPEVLMGSVVHDADGKVIADNLGYQELADSATGNFDVVLDVDLDGEPELVRGNGVYRYAGNGTAGTWVLESWYKGTAAFNGFVAVADFGDYPVAGLPAEIPEIVIVGGGTARVTRLDGTPAFGPYDLPSFLGPVGYGGPPTVGDFDGDGLPEFAAAGYGAYTVFDLACAKSPVPFGCQAEGVLWTRESKDASSNRTGSSVFDFEGDGIAEAVYADECYVRVYDGWTGNVVFSQPRTSCTWYENPVVADVDGDFSSEIVVGSNVNCDVECPAVDPTHRGIRCESTADCPGAVPVCSVGYCRCSDDAGCGDPSFACAQALPNTPGTGLVCRAKHLGPQSGIRVFRDHANRWVNSRPIWNQHAYTVTNVDESGRIPPRAEVQPNWLTLNNFRQNVQGEGDPTLAPDLTVKPGVLLNCSPDGKLVIPVEVCNRGASPANHGVPVAFFAGAAGAGGQILCLEHTQALLLPGQCEPVTCTVSPSTEPVDVHVVGDFGGTSGSYAECEEKNNQAVFNDVSCLNL